MKCYIGVKKSGDPGLLFKLDIDKAFDKLNCHYRISIPRQMGFGERWIKWIKFNFSTVRYSILVTKTHVGFFSPMRGIKQGDPLSPFLFILAVEVFAECWEGPNNCNGKKVLMLAETQAVQSPSRTFYLLMTLLSFVVQRKLKSSTWISPSCLLRLCQDSTLTYLKASSIRLMWFLTWRNWLTLCFEILVPSPLLN